MRLEKTRKILTILLIICIINVVLVNSTQAVGDIMDAGDRWIQQGSSQPVDDTKLIETSNMLYNVLLSIGVAVALIVGAILGIKFIVASVEEKAKLKEMILPYIVGCFVIFGAFGIWKAVISIGNSFEQAKTITTIVIARNI